MNWCNAQKGRYGREPLGSAVRERGAFVGHGVVRSTGLVSFCAHGKCRRNARIPSFTDWRIRHYPTLQNLMGKKIFSRAIHRRTCELVAPAKITHSTAS